MNVVWTGLWMVLVFFASTNAGAQTSTSRSFTPAVIFENSNTVKALRPNLNMDNSASILTGTDDPSVVAKNAPQGSLYLRIGPTGGQTYVKQDAGLSTNWLQQAGGGSVSSVGLTLPSIFSVTGSPVTSSGTIAATLASQAANSVWAGPASGPNAPPSFRALQAADLPGLPASQITSGQGSLTTTTSGVTVTTGTNTLLSSAAIDIATASGSSAGLLSSTDWTTFNNKQAAGTYITGLIGDVTASGPGSASATVAQVGGETAANIASATGLALAATDANTLGAIVKRDGSGNFSAGTITASLTGTASNTTALQGVAVAATAPTNGYVLKYNSTSTEWEPAVDGGGGGANAALSNLASVQINESLVFDSAATALVKSEDAANTSPLRIATGDASAGNSGDLFIEVGTATGTQGEIIVQARNVTLFGANDVAVNATSTATLGSTSSAGGVNVVSSQSIGVDENSAAVSVRSGATTGTGVSAPVELKSGDSEDDSGNVTVAAGASGTPDGRGLVLLNGKRIGFSSGPLSPSQYSTDPTDLSSYLDGDFYYNTTSKKLRFYNGTAWADVGGGGGGANTALSNIASTEMPASLRWRAPDASNQVYKALEWLPEAPYSDPVASIVAERTDSAGAPTDLIFKTTDNHPSIYERMRIKGDGVVSLGTSTAPIYTGGAANESTVTINAVPPSADPLRGMFTVADRTALASGVGGDITFAGVYNAGGDVTFLSQVKGYKENATDGEFGGGLSFSTRPDAGTLNERMKIDPAGKLFIKDPSLGSASTGYIWTLQNTGTGEGAWAAAPASQWSSVTGGIAYGSSVSIGGTQDPVNKLSLWKGTMEMRTDDGANGDKGGMIWVSEDPFQDAVAYFHAERTGGPGAPTDLVFETTDSAPTIAPRLRILSTGESDFQGNKVQNIATPTAGTDAATKDYVDGTVVTRWVKVPVVYTTYESANPQTPVSTGFTLAANEMLTAYRYDITTEFIGGAIPGGSFYIDLDNSCAAAEGSFGANSVAKALAQNLSGRNGSATIYLCYATGDATPTSDLTQGAGDVWLELTKFE